MENLSDICASVCAIAREAGQFIRRERLSFDSQRIEEKGLHNYVSYVDKQTEQLLVEKLSALLPGSGFIAEEGTATLGDEAYCWLIDPLDGTSNFIHDNCPYAVSIALRSRDELLVGVVYEIGRSECFYAWKDGGAWLNGSPIQVSNTATVEESFIAIGLPYNVEQYKPVANRVLDQLYGKASGLQIGRASCRERVSSPV